MSLDSTSIDSSSGHSKRRFLYYSLTLSLGVALLFAGLLYGLFTVGVPTPDATPEVAQRESFNAGVSSSVMLVGLGISALGLFGSIASVGYLRKS